MKSLFTVLSALVLPVLTVAIMAVGAWAVTR